MNLSIRYPELGKEIRIASTKENYLDEVNFHLQSSFGVGSDSFILLNEEGVSLKDKKIKSLTTDFIYIFLKDSLKKDKLELNIEFNLLKSDCELPLSAEERGVYIMEKKLFKLYAKALELSDFFKSYAVFAKQMESEIGIINKSMVVLELYHKKHIQDQLEAFEYLYNKNLAHASTAQSELSFFDEAVGRLSNFKIHPKLQSEGRETILNLIDAPQLSKWKESYVAEIGRLQTKFEELEGIIKQIPIIYQLPLIQENLLNTCEVSEDISKAASYSIDLYFEYRVLCEKYSNGDALAGARLHEEKWEKKCLQAQQFLSFLENSLEPYRKMIESIKNQRKAANVQLFNLLKKITEYAARIRDTVKSQLSMLSSLLKRSEKRLSFIKVPKLLPEAHDSTIAEISRRNHFVNVANDLKFKLNSLIEAEIAERIKFLEKYRHVLPNDFVPQLSAAPFIKIIVSADEPDLFLPQITEPVFNEFPNSCVSIKSSCENFISEEIENLNKKISFLIEENQRLEQEKLEFQQNEKLKSEEYEKTLNEMRTEQIQSNLKLLSCENNFNKKEEDYLQKIKNLENQIKEFRNKNFSELEEKLQKYENMIKNFKENEAANTLDREKLKKLLKQSTNEIEVKNKILTDTAKELEKLSEEFKIKEKIIFDLNLKLSREKAASEEFLLKRPAESANGLESLCNDLGISPDTDALTSYILDLKESISSKISFTNFTIGSLALFFPTSEGQFLAFNYNCPDNYLNLDSMSEKNIEMILSQPYIVGLITDIKKYVAEVKNPISLPVGTEFYLLSIKEVPSS